MAGKLTILMMILCTALVATASQQAKPTIDKLAWIAGCWEGEMRTGRTQEQWMRPEGNSMLGMSRTIMNGKTPFFEFLQIKPDGEELVYIARPQGAEPTTFKLIRCTDTEVAFENPQHDFPQRITYRLQPDKSLVARIEGKQNGKDRAVDFPMKRVKCD